MRVVLASSAVAAALAALYCPSSNDLMVAYEVGSVQLTNQGWTVNGGGAAATRTAFNLNDGYVEYDMDVSRSNQGVIPNIYSISPSGLGGGGYDSDTKYCDGAGVKPWCMELDFAETNGRCGGATTWHTVQGHDSDGCTSYGCRVSYKFGSPTFHMKVSYDGSGNPTVMRDGQILSGFSPSPEGGFAEKVRSTHASTGAVVYSSQWTSGWVPPPDDCPGHEGNGDLAGSSFSISNLRISGSVVQGPEPTKCTGPQPSPGPAPPTPGGQCQTFVGMNNDGTNLRSSADITNSADECCSRCGETSGCVGYTWVHKLNECWLKSVVGPPRDDACGGCVTSGTHSAPAPTPSPGPGPGPGPHTGCPGGSLVACIQTCPATIPVAFEACVGECQVRCSGPSCTGGDDGNSLTDCLSGCPTDKYADCVGCCASKFPSFIPSLVPSFVL